MGSGASTRNRYMGGKGFWKYFREDVWPMVADEFSFLGLTEQRAFDIFTSFARADFNENGLLSVDECFRFFGGKKTKLTERVFQSASFVDEDDQRQRGLKFKDFTLRLWSFCTLDSFGMARWVFEIMDIDDLDMLEEPDIQTMYKLVFDSEECDEEYIALYMFHESPKISKSNFAKITAKNPALIQPAIEYQQLLQKRIGGIKMWNSVSVHRRKKLSYHDEHSITLSDAMDSILEEARSVVAKQKQPTTEILLEQQQKLVAEQIAAAQEELRRRERQKESERRAKASTAPDRMMHQAWSIFSARKQEFFDEEFLVTDLERRCAQRNELFELFDSARKESIKYWEWKDVQDIKYVVGTDADHEARYQDYLKTQEGQTLQALVGLLRLFEVMELALVQKQRGITTGSTKHKKEKKKTQVHLLVEGYIRELSKVLDGIRSTDVDSKEHEKRWRLLLNRNFDEEQQFAKQNARKKQRQEADEITHKELCAERRTKTLADLERRLRSARDEREKDFLRKEFDIVTNFGSRTTKWEYVLEKDENRFFYIHRDSLERRHPKTAICEYCDFILVQHELRCDGCNAKRSAKNLKLYRPLGFKDITQE